MLSRPVTFDLSCNQCRPFHYDSHTPAAWALVAGFAAGAARPTADLEAALCGVSALAACDLAAFGFAAGDRTALEGGTASGVPSPESAAGLTSLARFVFCFGGLGGSLSLGAFSFWTAASSAVVCIDRNVLVTASTLV